MNKLILALCLLGVTTLAVSSEHESRFEYKETLSDCESEDGLINLAEYDFEEGKPQELEYKGYGKYYYGDTKCTYYTYRANAKC